jgi:integrase
MELVTIRGVSKRTRVSRSLTVEEFHSFMEHLAEPFHTIALICVSFGLRISECLALKWSDIDWLNGKISVQRGIVRQRVNDVKTVYSRRRMSVDAGILAVLNAWKQTTQFACEDDWVFASPTQLGRQPWSYDQVGRVFFRAAEKAGIGRLGTHAMRPHLPKLAGCGRNLACSPAETHASCRHQNHNERVRGRGYR